MSEKITITGASCCGTDCCGGCIAILVVVFLLWSWLWYLPTPWGNLEIDVFPPAIRLINQQINE